MTDDDAQQAAWTRAEITDGLAHAERALFTRPAPKSARERRVGDEPDAEFFQDGQQRLDVVGGDQVLVLQRRDRYRVGPADGVLIGVGQAEVRDLARRR
ncbi:hypothetical protein GA0115254_109626 [Streptomyces sp. Ncost-T10-10d]|nr:hypothetical protein [Streptomyces sp. Ncost-T10-10d]SCF65488.1 hypothetical protein GA0115254_109626 [Streptomyces sp. Ncost-T10-10d]